MKIKTNRPLFDPRVLGATSGGIEPAFDTTYKRKWEYRLHEPGQV